MSTFEIEADLAQDDIQNLQEWGTTWGEIQQEIERIGGEMADAYVVLGRHDFRFTFEAEDEEAALKVAMAIERRGLDTHTNQLVDVERLGELVEDA